MRRLMTGVRSEKYVVRRFSRCANVTECTYTNLDSTAYYTPSLNGTAYCSQAIVTQWQVLQYFIIIS